MNDKKSNSNSRSKGRKAKGNGSKGLASTIVVSSSLGKVQQQQQENLLPCNSEMCTISSDKGSLLSIRTSLDDACPVEQYLRHKNLEQLAIIGEGGFSTVYKVKNILDGKIYAAKVMRLSLANRLWIDKCLKNEMYISKVLKHPNIVMTFQYFKTKTYAVIVMQYASNGSIKNEMDVRGSPYDEPEALRYFIGLLAGLQHIHLMNIAHRDLKLENFFLDEHRQPLIGDFGFATVGAKQRKMILDSVMRNSLCGTEGYMAPEIARLTVNQQYNAKAADIYSMGVCCYEMMHHALPFGKDPATNQEVYERINMQLIAFRSTVSSGMRELLKSMLRLTPQQRPNVTEILNRLQKDKVFGAIKNLFNSFM